MKSAVSIAGPVPPGWIRVPDNAGDVPLWQWHDEPVYVATRDMDQLRFIGAALVRFDQMSAEEFHEFVSSSTVRLHRAPDIGTNVSEMRSR